MRRPGTLVLEFLPAIPPGLPRGEFMAQLQRRIETASARLIPADMALSGAAEKADQPMA
jgi:1-acyl-sn-glycerol-3-phosphate acyltransferase